MRATLILVALCCLWSFSHAQVQGRGDRKRRAKASASEVDVRNKWIRLPNGRYYYPEWRRRGQDGSLFTINFSGEIERDRQFRPITADVPDERYSYADAYQRSWPNYPKWHAGPLAPRERFENHPDDIYNRAVNPLLRTGGAPRQETFSGQNAVRNPLFIGRTPF